MKFYFLCFKIWIILSPLFIWTQDNLNNAPIFVQATPGSFNHQALELLSDYKGRENIQFCGSPKNVLNSAYLEHGNAFVAIRNTCIPGNMVEATLDALREFQIVKVIASINMKINLALLRHQNATIPFTSIASHPAALKQIYHWKSQKENLQEIPIIEGTAEAARQLSNGILALNVAVIGSKNLTYLYPNLIVTEENIQDLKENHTTFVLIEVIKRKHIITKPEVIKEINLLLNF